MPNPNPALANLEIDARPTKDLFIDMLVKDIPLIRAIIDLVDNSVDGALRIGGTDYDGLWVRVICEKNLFKISDNCGGMSVDLARNYAFRFGRPDGMKKLPHSVGQFGVGMKRALFKLGSNFKVESLTKNSRFVVEEDVKKWKEDKETWHFNFKELEEDIKVPKDNQGTTIIVQPLDADVSTQFALQNFQKKLFDEMTAAHQVSVDKKLAISLNGIPLQSRPAQLLQSPKLKPARKDLIVNKTHAPVSVKIYAGVTESKPVSAGWYVFCNGRMVLEADQTNTTGWGEGGETKIPKYHNQFARFRGYVLFDCDDASLLPWNTTKTGVDVDSPIFLSVRQHMITLMRPVIDFLNKLDEEMSKDKMLNDKILKEKRPIQTLIATAKAVKLSDVKKQGNFEAKPKAQKAEPPSYVVICYSKTPKHVERVKERLNVESESEVGSKTFDYYYNLECKD